MAFRRLSSSFASVFVSSVGRPSHSAGRTEFSSAVVKSKSSSAWPETSKRQNSVTCETGSRVRHIMRRAPPSRASRAAAASVSAAGPRLRRPGDCYDQATPSAASAAKPTAAPCEAKDRRPCRGWHSLPYRGWQWCAAYPRSHTKVFLAYPRGFFFSWRFALSFRGHAPSA